MVNGEERDEPAVEGRKELRHGSSDPGRDSRQLLAKDGGVSHGGVNEEIFDFRGGGHDNGGRVVGCTRLAPPDQSNNHKHQEVQGNVERTQGLVWSHRG